MIMKNDINHILILVVESSSKKDSDYIYVMELLKNYYNNSLFKLPIKFVFMKGKNNYNNKIVKEEIKEYTKNAKSYDVIYLFDKDDNSLDYRDNDFSMKVTSFCKKITIDLFGLLKI